MRAIVLAGGLGTRLRSIIRDVPKPMAPVGGRPFLSYVLDYLIAEGIDSIVLSVGYMHDMVSGYFGDRYKQSRIFYNVEQEPLGTGGALRSVIRNFSDEYFYVVNGDTLFPVDLQQLYKLYIDRNSDVVVAGRIITDAGRYGAISLQGNQISRFSTLHANETPCIINGGVYLVRNHIFDRFNLPAIFSFENDFLSATPELLNMRCAVFDSYFIDIGVPEDYKRANLELPGMYNV